MTSVKERDPQNLATRQSCRDLELLRFVGRHGVVTIAHVMTAMGAGRTATYRRVAACIEAGLIERVELVRAEPGLLRATRDGLRYAGLGLPVATITPGAVDHWLRCASTAQMLGERYGHDRVLTEREIVLAELIEGRPIASAEVGELPNGRPRLHRPDLVVLPPGLSAVDCETTTQLQPGTGGFGLSGWESSGPSSPRTQGGRRSERTEVRERGARTEDNGMRRVPAGPIAIEVELTPKSPRRLQGIIRAWRRASWVGEVHYHCEPGQARRAVERAVVKTHAEERIRILEAVSR